MKTSCAAMIGLLAWGPGMVGAATVGGTLSGNTLWTPAMNPVIVLTSVTIPAGATLSVQAGTLVQLTNGASISASSGTIAIEGTAESPVMLVPATGTNAWGTLNASGAAGSLTIRQAEVAFGGIHLGSQATGLIEDVYVHDVSQAITSDSAHFVTLRRVHVNEYSSCVFNSGTVILAEDSLFENMRAPNSDALEIQDGPRGSIVRRCTFRHSHGNNSDAVDFNGSQDVFVHDCLVYDFADKAFSFGTATAFNQPPCTGIILSNCFVYGVDTCLAVKDKSTASLYQNTFAGAHYGVRLYQKYSTPVAGGGGRITNGWNNVLWGNGTNILVATNSAIDLAYSDVGGVNLPGLGNLDLDPLFVNAAEQDDRLADASPCRGAGLDGIDMGCLFPVGAPMALSQPKILCLRQESGIVTVCFWADSGKTYSVFARSAVATGTWLKVADVSAQDSPRLVEIPDGSATNTARFYRLATPQQL